MFRHVVTSFMAVLLAVSTAHDADAATRTWVGGNDPWDGDIFNWSGNDEPDPDDDVVFNTNNHVEMAMDNEIQSLVLSNGIDLDTETYYLDVNGDVTLSDSGTILRAGESGLSGLPATSVSAYNVTVGNGATYANANFTSFIHPSAIGLFDVNNGGTLFGHGTIRNGDGISSPTVVLENDGVIRPGTVADGLIIIGGAPTARTLTLSAIDGDARIDLDGSGGSGAVDVTRNQTLDIDIELNDVFDGTIDLSHNATLDIEDAWGFSGTMNVDNGFVAGQPFPFLIPDIPADVAYLQGGAITMSGAASEINVVDGDGTLQFDASFTADAGTINNNGLIVFNDDATINAGVDFNMIGVTAGMTVGAGATVTINDADMDFDGSGASTNVITVEAGGLLDFNLDSFEGNDRADGFLTLNSGSLSLSVTDGSWTMDRKLNLNNTTGVIPVVYGSAVMIGADSGVNDADVRVTGNGSSQINSAVTWNSDADVDVEAGATLAVIGFSTFNSVNGAESADFDGPGDIYFSGGQVNEATTLNFSGGTVGLDGGGAPIIFLTAPDFTLDAPLTINAAQIDEYGRSSFFPVGSQSELTINNGGGGRLEVNLDNAADAWTVNNVGVMNVNGGALLFSTFLTGNELEMNGTLNVDGLSRSNAKLSITGTVNTVDAAARLRLDGGDLSDTNRMEGGVINGPGRVGLDASHALVGYGTINSDIQFYNTSNRVKADDGVLTINGAFVGTGGSTGTDDADGILDVTNPWNTSSFVTVSLNGGEVRGAAIHNDGAGGIHGEGLITAGIRNDTVVAADVGGTLTLNNSANDWDGPANGGTLRAVAASTLELNDNAAFLFNGTVDADNATVHANGFELEFDPASTLALADGGTYRSTHATDVGGTVSVGAGAASTLNISGTTVFENTSTTTLNGDLILDNPATRVESGAIFSGGGALINTVGRMLVLEDGANVDVLVQNNGTVALGNSPGQTTGADYEQTAGGLFEIELAGTGLSDYDRMTLTGLAQLDGDLAVSLISGFNPVLNDAFTILSAASGVVNMFSFEDFSSAPLDPGLAWDVIYNPTNVQLLVVDVTADLDNDGDVDGSDFLSIQRTDPSLIPTWEEQFGTGVPAAVAGAAALSAVPEPGSILLTALGGAMALLTRRRLSN